MDLEPGFIPESILVYREGMRQVARAHGAPLVDGPAYFQEKGASVAFFRDQVHPSRLGHHLLGAALAGTLHDLYGDLGPGPASR